jgi:glycosyltransferase involved in cell wall biosynthesis
MGHKMTFWSNDQKRIEPYVTELEKRGIEVIYDHKSFHKFFKERQKIYQVCIATRPYFSKKYIDIIKKLSKQCKIIYVAADLHYLRMIRQAYVEKSKVSLMRSLELKKLELSIMKISDITVFHGENECAFALNENESLKLAVIPIPYVIDIESKSFKEREGLLFLGNYKHTPNVDSLEYFIKDIFPIIRKELPDLKLYVIGSNISDKLTLLCNININCVLLGYVKDLTPYLSSCKIMVSPLRYGAGIKGKIITSMLSSLPVVTTSIGAEGMFTAEDPELLIGDSPLDFAAHVIDLYQNQTRWNELSHKAKDFAQINYSPELVRASFGKVFDYVLDN